MKTRTQHKTVAQPSPNPPLRVSIVEDDAPAREILTDWLANAQGFEFVSEFGSAEEGIAQLPRQKPDVVLMDIKLPGMSGVDCVRHLKPLLPRTQFVMHTVYEDSNHIFHALQAGATGYLLKQSAHDELLAAIKYVHAGGSPMTSYIARRVAQCFSNPPAKTETDDELSPREREVIEMLARGFLYKEIAETLNISIRTVDTYIRRIYEKLHVRSRAQAVAKYVSFPFSDSAPASTR
jgi:DNA-binding NarL/FixJ family response regulator